MFLTMSACSRVAQSTESNDYAAYPKASEDATMVYQLRSNLERTHFFVDDKELGIGKKLMVRLNNQGHTIVAQPENCEISKEEFIQPPYSAEVPLSFTFVTGDCEPVVADNTNNTTGSVNGLTFGNVEGPVIITTGNQNNISNNSAPAPRERTSSSSTPKKTPEKQKVLKKAKVPSENRQSALNEIAVFVQNVCKSTQDRGHSQNLGLSGSAKAELNGLLKSLANLGIEGAAEYQSSDYQGVLQKDLSGLLSKDADCRREISAMLINKLIK